MIDHATLPETTEKSTKEPEALPFIHHGPGGKQSETSHLGDSGNEKQCKCSSSWKLVFLLVATAALAIVLTCCIITPHRRSHVGVSLPGFGDVNQTLAVEAMSGEATRQKGNEVVQLEELEPALLPQCYSSPAADPSEGSWKKVDGGVAKSPTTSMHIGRSRCADHWAKEHAGEGLQPYWTWEPSVCTLDEVDAAKFCRAMTGRKGLLFLGDSMSHLMAVTLASVLSAKLVRNPQSIKHFTACGGKTKISWYRSDVLDVGTTSYTTDYCNRRKTTSCVLFAKDSILQHYDTVVVNAGVHPTAGGVSEYEEMMTSASKALTSSLKRLHGGNEIFVVRNSVPGHWECGDRTFDGPVDRGLASKLVDNGPAEFAWPTIVEKNKILEEAFNKNDSWRLLDAYTPTFLRADSHIGGEDCVHYCMPGPVDHWVVLLYNMLFVETSGGK